MYLQLALRGLDTIHTFLKENRDGKDDGKNYSQSAQAGRNGAPGAARGRADRKALRL
jgi:hypothetical protein